MMNVCLYVALATMSTGLDICVCERHYGIELVIRVYDLRCIYIKSISSLVEPNFPKAKEKFSVGIHFYPAIHVNRATDTCPSCRDGSCKHN